MSNCSFSKEVELPVSAAEAFAWHKQKGTFARLMPPWEKIEVQKYAASIADGSKAELYCRLFGPLGFKWILEHSDYIPGKQFCDQQVKGPFASYRHSHLFSEESDKTVLKDLIEYSLPVSMISNQIVAPLIERRFERIFCYRHRITVQDLGAHALYKDRTKLHFLISGASGMIGKALSAFLQSGGHRVTKIVRSIGQAEAGDVVLGTKGETSLATNCNFDCVVNLAGAGIADSPWTESRKQILLDSRVRFTKNLVTALKSLAVPPKVMISASGIGYYGDTKQWNPDESAAQGKGFLAELSARWEEAASTISDSGCRLIRMRLGAVLSPSGGILKRMIYPFSLGLGGKLGGGKQQFAWVAIDDVLRAILFMAYSEDICGAINVVAPAMITNAHFSKALGTVLNRPTVINLPAPLLRFLLGELAEELLLSSSAAKPLKLINSGFKFLFEDVEQALAANLGLY